MHNVQIPFFARNFSCTGFSAEWCTTMPTWATKLKESNLYMFLFILQYTTIYYIIKICSVTKMVALMCSVGVM